MNYFRPWVSFLSVLTGLSIALTATGRARSQTTTNDATSGPEAANGVGPESPLVILMSPSVQKELKLTDDQKDKVYNQIREASQKSRQFMQQMMIRGGDPRALLESGQQLRRENDKAIGKLLEKKQNVRFEQIVLQSEGPLAVGRKEIANKLGLSNNQYQAVQNVMLQYQQSKFQIMMVARRAEMTGAGGGGNVEQATRQLRKEAVQQIGKVVNKKQRDAFNELLGEPFDIAKISPGAAGTETAKAKSGESASETAAPKDADSSDAPVQKAKNSRRGAKANAKKP